MPKALRFAQDGSRHGGSEGGLVECLVTFNKPKFVKDDDRGWQAEGYDACRADHTSASTHTEWCLRDPSQLQVLKLFRLPLKTPAPSNGSRFIPIKVSPAGV